MPIEQLRAAWEQVKGLRRGPYSNLTPEQQAGAILARKDYGAALAYAEGLMAFEGRGYWTDVADLIRAAS